MMNVSTPLPRSEPNSECSEWVDVCALTDLIPGTGMAALVRGQQVAVIRARNGVRVYALSNFDPFSKAFVLSRGICGDAAGVPKIASPIYKQCFNLLTGECLDDPSVRIPVYPVRVEQGRVALLVPRSMS
jgi:nitrite reductase (NADH) small subunit